MQRLLKVKYQKDINTFMNFIGSKAVAIQAVVIVVLIGFFLFFLVIVFNGWVEIHNCEVVKFVCSNKQTAHCLEWWKNDKTLHSGKPAELTVKDCVRDEEGKPTFPTCHTPTRPECLESLDLLKKE